MRLAPSRLEAVPSEVGRFQYARDQQDIGIVHIGLGAFHRAHQAVYTEEAMNAGDRNWAICGVSLRSAAVREQLRPQAGLFSVTERDGASEATRIVGAVRAVLTGTDEPQAVIGALGRSTTQIVTLTVTEKGYLATADGELSTDLPDLSHDLAGGSQPRTLYGFLAAGLAVRRSVGLPGLTIVSCDNLAGNGVRLGRYLAQFLDRTDPSLRAWFDRECACPSTMVDRIVPATTEAQIDEVERRLGVRDEAAVMTEPFSQWVIEDRFAGPRPRWDLGGAQFVADVTPYEDAKLRMLNGAHSTLAYVGLQRGHTYVHEAIADLPIRDLVTRLMLSEAAPTLPHTPGLDPTRYAAQLMERFSNSALAHRLEQIAMDGSQKIPQRWFPTLSVHQREGRQCPAILEALASWVRHVQPGSRDVSDPMSDTLAEIWRQAGSGGVARALFGPAGLFASGWTATESDLAFLGECLEASK